ncbi:hypothetical protein [Brevibacillus brevis]|uniref:Uncharacterized protein n=1 Tax=Brevibacillus brevis TaxID=1393 RepID=A0ABY9TEZ4_BREBE|nr:hypothetical protein [Brevibacillus brevis]WNC17862.1 hypothetical protein RGB73_30095 [Brevibacillus brevis]
MWNKVKGAAKSAWQSGKKAILNASAAVAVLVGGAVSASAADAVDTTQITTTFTDITTTVLTVIGAVAATAVTVMGVILAWKYGRKLFSMIAK